MAIFDNQTTTNFLLKSDMTLLLDEHTQVVLNKALLHSIMILFPAGGTHWNFLTQTLQVASTDLRPGVFF